MRLEYNYSKKDIYQLIKKQKELLNGILLTFEIIEKKMKPKPNHPDYYKVEFELKNNFKVLFQATKDDEFPEYTAMLFKNKTPICRIDYHESHRRNCKKEIFNQREYNELHIHLYCNECIKEKFKWDSFVLDLEKDFKDFEGFCELFCKITNINSNFSQKRLL